MNSIVTQRFITCVNELREQKAIRSLRQFAKTLDYLPQGLSEVMNGRRDATIELIRKAVERYKFNSCYLLTGEGEPLLIEGSQNLNVLSIVVDSNNDERIIHVPVPAQAGYADQFHDPVFIQELPTYTLPDYSFKTGTYRSFDVSGPSMQPTLYKSDRVICSYIESNYWQHAIKDHQLYVIVTKEGIVVKRLLNHIRENRSVQCISDNREYQPYQIDVVDIRELWKVRLRMTTRLDSPDHQMRILQDQIDRQHAMIESLCENMNAKNKIYNPPLL